MMEIIEFIFGSFWRWFGAFLIISVVFNGLWSMCKSFNIKIKTKGDSR